MDSGNPDLKYIDAAFIGRQTKNSDAKEQLFRISHHGLKLHTSFADFRMLKRLLQYALITTVLLFIKVYTF